MPTPQQMALVDWLQASGGYVHPDLDLFSELPNGDRGVRALKPIPAGDQLVLIPKSLCIYLRDHEGAKAQVGASGGSPPVACLQGAGEEVAAACAGAAPM